MTTKGQDATQTQRAVSVERPTTGHTDAGVRHTDAGGVSHGQFVRENVGALVPSQEGVLSLSVSSQSASRALI